MTPARQLALDLGHRTALGAEDFLVGDSNRAALAAIDLWPHWPHWACLVVGSAQCGKTHLAHVWRVRSNGQIVDAAGVGEGDIARLKAARALVVENLEAGIADETALFHLLNVAREEKLSMLLTSRVPPGELAIALPDLRSRIRALHLVTIEAPDDALLKAVLVKHFADRQLQVEPHVVDHIARHMERSMASAGRVVAEIDRRGLADRRRVTRALAGEVLADLGRGESDRDG